MILINIFGYEKKKVNVLRKSANYKRENIVDLLLINEGEVQHYRVIKNLSSSYLISIISIKRKSIFVKDA